MQSNEFLGFFCKIDTFVTDKERHKTEQRQQQGEECREVKISPGHWCISPLPNFVQ